MKEAVEPGRFIYGNFAGTELIGNVVFYPKTGNKLKSGLIFEPTGFTLIS